MLGKTVNMDCREVYKSADGPENELHFPDNGTNVTSNANDSVMLDGKNVNCIKNDSQVMSTHESLVACKPVCERQSSINDVDAAEILMDISTCGIATFVEQKVEYTNGPSNASGDCDGSLDKLEKTVKVESRVCTENSSTSLAETNTVVSCSTVLSPTSDIILSPKSRNNAFVQMLIEEEEAVSTDVQDNTLVIVEPPFEVTREEIKTVEEVGSSHCVTEVVDEGDAQLQSSVDTSASGKHNMDVSDLVIASEKLIAGVDKAGIHGEGNNDFDVENASDLLIAFANKVRDVAVNAVSNDEFPNEGHDNEETPEMLNESFETSPSTVQSSTPKSNHESLSDANVTVCYPAENVDKADINLAENSINQEENLNKHEENELLHFEDNELDSLDDSIASENMDVDSLLDTTASSDSPIDGGVSVSDNLPKATFHNTEKPMTPTSMSSPINAEVDTNSSTQLNEEPSGEPKEKSDDALKLSPEVKVSTPNSVSRVKLVQDICNALAPDILKMDNLHSRTKKDILVLKADNYLDNVEDDLSPIPVCVDIQVTGDVQLNVGAEVSNEDVVSTNTIVPLNTSTPSQSTVIPPDSPHVSTFESSPVQTTGSHQTAISGVASTDAHEAVFESVSARIPTSFNLDSSCTDNKLLSIDRNFLRQEMLKLLPELLMQVNQNTTAQTVSEDTQSNADTSPTSVNGPSAKCDMNPVTVCTTLSSNISIVPSAISKSMTPSLSLSNVGIPHFPFNSSFDKKEELAKLQNADGLPYVDIPLMIPPPVPAVNVRPIVQQRNKGKTRPGVDGFPPVSCLYTYAGSTFEPINNSMNNNNNQINQNMKFKIVPGIRPIRPRFEHINTATNSDMLRLPIFVGNYKIQPPLQLVSSSFPSNRLVTPMMVCQTRPIQGKGFHCYTAPQSDPAIWPRISTAYAISSVNSPCSRAKDLVLLNSGIGNNRICTANSMPSSETGCGNEIESGTKNIEVEEDDLVSLTWLHNSSSARVLGKVMKHMDVTMTGEKIVDSVTKDGKNFYKVKWESYSWEEEKNLVNCDMRDMLKGYHASKVSNTVRQQIITMLDVNNAKVINTAQQLVNDAKVTAHQLVNDAKVTNTAHQHIITMLDVNSGQFQRIAPKQSNPSFTPKSSCTSNPSSSTKRSYTPKSLFNHSSPSFGITTQSDIDFTSTPEPHLCTSFPKMCASVASAVIVSPFGGTNNNTVKGMNSPCFEKHDSLVNESLRQINLTSNSKTNAVVPRHVVSIDTSGHEFEEVGSLVTSKESLPSVVIVSTGQEADPLAGFVGEVGFHRVTPILLPSEPANPNNIDFKGLNFAETVLKNRKKEKGKKCEEDELHECEHCDRKLKLDAFTKHQHMFSTFTCPRCDIQICDKKKLSRHIMSHATFAYQCSTCLKGFKDVLKFRSHKKKAHPKKKCATLKRDKWERKGSALKCVCCRKAFRNKFVFVRHQRKFCPNDARRDGYSMCNVCNKLFTTEEKLNKHIELHQISYKECKICEECFEVDEDDEGHECTGVPNIQYVFDHDNLRQKLKSNMQVNVKRHIKWESKKANTCVQCVQGFKNRDDFYDHINSRTCITIKNNGQCMLCKKSFQCLDNLQAHVMACFKDSLTSLLRPNSKDSDPSSKVEHGSKKRAVYHCSRCSTLFPSICAFKKHKLLHEQRKPVCYNCEFVCLSRRKMKHHVRTKSCLLEHYYPCFVCDALKVHYARFASIAQLADHLKSHKFRKKKRKVLLPMVKPVKIASDAGLNKLLTLGSEDIKKLLSHPGYCHIQGFGTFKVFLSGISPNQILNIQKVSPLKGKEETIELHSKEITVRSKSDIPKHSCLKNSVVKESEDLHVLNAENKEAGIVVQERNSSLSPSNSSTHRYIGSKCFDCWAQLSNEVDILNHFRLHHKWRVIQLNICTKCNIAFKDVRTYGLHICAAEQENLESSQHQGLNLVHVKETNIQCVRIACDCLECHQVENNIQGLLPTTFIGCKLCNGSFQCLRQIRYHQILKHPSKPYIFVCELCDLPFIDYEGLRKHDKELHDPCVDFSSHVMVLDWPCYLCKAKISSISKHVLSHAVVMLECYRCNVKVSSKSMLVLHMDKVHACSWTLKDDMWVKGICDSATNDMVFKLYKNREVDSNASQKQEDIAEDTDSHAKCISCAAVFFHKSTLERHKEVGVCTAKHTEEIAKKDLQAKEETANCVECLPITKNKDDAQVKNKVPVTQVDSEKRKVGDVKDATASDVKRVLPGKYFQAECSICRQLFYTKRDCGLHLNKTHGVDVLTLTSTVKMLALPGISAPGQYCCEICRFSYPTQKSLWKHAFEHFDVKFEFCHICMLSFSTVGELKLHVLSSHKGYLCTCCYKAFHSFAAYKHHTQVHVLEVNVPRDENGKMVIEVDDGEDDLSRKKEKLFDESDSLFHISSKIPKSYLEDVRLFYCHVCEKNIEGELTFIVHMKTHLVPRRLLCIICRGKFDDEEEFKVHVNGHFDEEKVVIDDKGIDADAVDESQEKCRICSEVFLSQLDKETHLDSPECQRALSKNEIKTADSISFYVQKYVDEKTFLDSGGRDRGHDWPLDWQVAEGNNLSSIFRWWLGQKKGKSAHPRIQSRFSYNYFICPYCHVFLKNSNVVPHLQKHVGTNSKMQCAYCYNNFSHDGLYTHMKTKHPDFYKKFNLLTNINCQFCSALLALNDIPSHMLKHTKGLSIVSSFIHCAYCSLTMTHKGLKLHMHLESEVSKKVGGESTGSKQDEPSFESLVLSPCASNDGGFVEKHFPLSDLTAEGDDSITATKYLEQSEQPLDLKSDERSTGKNAEEKSTLKHKKKEHTATSKSSSKVKHDDSVVSRSKERNIKRKIEHPLKVDKTKVSEAKSNDEEVKAPKRKKVGKVPGEESEDHHVVKNNAEQGDLVSRKDPGIETKHTNTETGEKVERDTDVLKMRIRRKKGSQEYESTPDKVVGKQPEKSKDCVILSEGDSTSKNDEAAVIHAAEVTETKCIQHGTVETIGEDRNDIGVDSPPPERRSKRRHAKDGERHKTQPIKEIHRSEKSKILLKPYSDNMETKETKTSVRPSGADKRTKESKALLRPPGGNKESKETDNKETKESKASLRSPGANKPSKETKAFLKPPGGCKETKEITDDTEIQHAKMTTRKAVVVVEDVEKSRGKKVRRSKSETETDEDMEVQQGRRKSRRINPEKGNTVEQDKRSIKDNASTPYEMENSNCKKSVDKSKSPSQMSGVTGINMSRKTSLPSVLIPVESPVEHEEEPKVSEIKRSRRLSIKRAMKDGVKHDDPGESEPAISVPCGMEEKHLSKEVQGKAFDAVEMRVDSRKNDKQEVFPKSTENTKRVDAEEKQSKKVQRKGADVVEKRVDTRKKYQQEIISKNSENSKEGNQSTNVDEKGKAVTEEDPETKVLNEIKAEEKIKEECEMDVSLMLLGLCTPKCCICDWTLPTPSELKVHLFKHLYDPSDKTKLSSRDVHCIVCAKIIRKSSLKSHLRIVHQREVDHQHKLESQGSTPTKENQPSPRGDMSTRSRTDVYILHDAADLQASSPYPYNCCICLKGYFTASLYLMHLKGIHPWLYEKEKEKIIKSPRGSDKEMEIVEKTPGDSEMAETRNSTPGRNKEKKEKREVTSTDVTDDASDTALPRKSSRIGSKMRSNQGSMEGVKGNLDSKEHPKDVPEKTAGQEAVKAAAVVVGTPSPQKKKNKNLRSTRSQVIDIEDSSELDTSSEIAKETVKEIVNETVKTKYKNKETDRSSRSQKGKKLHDFSKVAYNEKNKNSTVCKNGKSRKTESDTSLSLSEDSGSEVEEETEEEIVESSSNEDETIAKSKIGSVDTSVGNSSSLYCAQCNALFTQQSELDMHLTVHQNNPERFFNVPYPYVCLFCGNGYYKTYNLKRHLQVKHVAFYTTDLEKTPSFTRQAPGLHQVYEKSSKQVQEEDITVLKRDRSRFTAVLHNVTVSSSDTSAIDSLENSELTETLEMDASDNSTICEQVQKLTEASFTDSMVNDTPQKQHDATKKETPKKEASKKKKKSKASTVTAKITESLNLQQESTEPAETPKRETPRRTRTTKLLECQVTERSEVSESPKQSEAPIVVETPKLSEITETPENSPMSERRMSGRKRSINKDVLEFLRGNKSKTSQKAEKPTPNKSNIEDTKQNTTSNVRKVINDTSVNTIEEEMEVVDTNEIITSDCGDKGDNSSSQSDADASGVSDDSESDEETLADKVNKQSKQSFVCKYCDWVFNRHTDLSKHRKGHSRDGKKGTNLLTCVSCRKTFPRHDLKWHMHTVHADDRTISLKVTRKKYCLKCNFGTKSKRDLEVHMGTSHPELLKVECRLCDERFSAKSFYSQHFKIAHGKSMDEETLMCFLCNKKFKSLPKLHHHYSIVHMKKNESISCSLCSKFFYAQIDLDEHQERFHKDDKFQCGLCLVEFERVEQCEEHVYIHKKKSEFKCKLCNFYFKSRDVLDKHISTHETQILTCDVCNSDFKSLSEYQSHKDIHRNEINDGGSNLSFNSDTSLDSKEHCVNKTYNCSCCDKTFRLKSEIRAHMDKVHHGGTHAICSSEKETTDEEPADQEEHDMPTINLCNECGQTFLRPEIFAEHQKTHLAKVKEQPKKRPLSKSKRKSRK